MIASQAGVDSSSSEPSLPQREPHCLSFRARRNEIRDKICVQSGYGSIKGQMMMESNDRTGQDVSKMVLDVFIAAVMAVPEWRKVRVEPLARDIIHFAMCPRANLGFPPSSFLLADSRDDDGFAEWTPVDSPIDAQMATRFEKFLGCDLPPSFVTYLTYKCIWITAFWYGTLPTICPESPLGWLVWSTSVSRRGGVYRERPWLLPFASTGALDGELCFDTRFPDPEGEYPIIIASDGYYLQSSGEDVLDTPVFDSFLDYVRFLTDHLVFCSLFPRPRVEDFTRWLRENGKYVPPAFFL